MTMLLLIAAADMIIVVIFVAIIVITIIGLQQFYLLHDFKLDSECILKTCF